MKLDLLQQYHYNENKWHIRIRTDDEDEEVVTTGWYMCEGDEKGIKAELRSNSVDA